MDKIILELNNPTWWFSVVIAGFLVNFITNLAFKKFEQYRASISQKRSKELTHRKELEEKVIEELTNSSFAMNYLYQQILSLKINSVLMLLLGIIVYQMGDYFSFVLLAPTLLYLLGTIATYMALNYYKKSHRMNNILERATDTKIKKHPELKKLLNK